MRVLGIESSCDETGVAVYDDARGLLSNLCHSQEEVHAPYGGVVPELAARDHIRRLLPLVQQALKEADSSAQQLDGIAYTLGPGLLGALLVGASLGRSLAFAWDLPALGVHHLEGHLLSPMLEHPAPRFPFVSLLVSGAHTQLLQVTDVGCYQLLGDSLDDAAGECFDKVAKMLGLGYPGGPVLSRLAECGKPTTLRLPRPMAQRGLDFSFSGLKTAVLEVVREARRRESPLGEQSRANIAYAFQEAVVDTLRIKCLRALESTALRTLVVAGGVSANHLLRHTLEQALQPLGAQVHYARPELCTDNGAMIAYAGYLRLRAGERDGLELHPRPRWPVQSLQPPGKAQRQAYIVASG